LALTEEQRLLVLENIGYAENVAKVVAKTLPLEDVGMSIEDCVQQGLLGLAQAAARFDAVDHDPSIATVETRFRSYAYLRIRGAVIDECRRLSLVPRGQRGSKPIALSLDYEGAESLGAKPDPDRDDWIDIQRGLDLLDDADREVAVGMMAGVPLTELAPRLGQSEGQLQAAAKRIREALSDA
jgi:RNA polymerase sigma factor (sigma-70 family)